jgi:hypothetical protein
MTAVYGWTMITWFYGSGAKARCPPAAYVHNTEVAYHFEWSPLTPLLHGTFAASSRKHNRR